MNILVIGDAMVDEYFVGKIKRLNPEKHSVPLLDVERAVTMPGGAANVHANLKALGVDATLISGAGCITKVRIVDDSGVICRFDEGDKLDPIEVRHISDEALRELDALIISDYAKGSVTEELAEDLEQRAKCPVFVDTKGDPKHWLRFATCMFPNAAEFYRHPYKYQRAKSTFTTFGSFGAKLYKAGVASGDFESVATKVLNVAGAGDTVVAAFVVAFTILAEFPIAHLRAAEFAMQAAAVSVSKPLTHAPTIEEICTMFPGQVNVTLIEHNLRRTN